MTFNEFKIIAHTCRYNHCGECDHYNCETRACKHRTLSNDGTILCPVRYHISSFGYKSFKKDLMRKRLNDL